MKKQCKLSIQLHTEVLVQTMCQKKMVSVIKSSFTSINHIFRAQFYFFHYFNDYCYCASQHTSYFLCCEQKQREGLNLRAPSRVSERSTNNQSVPKLQASLKSFDCSRQGGFDWIKSNLIFCYCSILISPVFSITIFLVHVSVLPHLCLDAEYLVSCLFIIITCCCCVSQSQFSPGSANPSHSGKLKLQEVSTTSHGTLLSLKKERYFPLYSNRQKHCRYFHG